MSQKGLPVTQESYESYKVYRKPRWNKQFNSWKDVEDLYDLQNNNHRVLSVEKLEGTHDIYDISVDEWHNFRLSIGVVVSNTYRFKYYAYKGGYLYGDPGKAAEFPKKTNPNDSLGSMCKHIASVLTNKVWILKVSAAVNNYIRLNKDKCYPYLDLEVPQKSQSIKVDKSQDEVPQDTQEPVTQSDEKSDDQVVQEPVDCLFFYYFYFFFMVSFACKSLSV